jgi:hypothetical protein
MLLAVSGHRLDDQLLYSNLLQAHLQKKSYEILGMLVEVCYLTPVGSFDYQG